jgi:hypothetical protein
MSGHAPETVRRTGGDRCIELWYAATAQFVYRDYFSEYEEWPLFGLYIDPTKIFSDYRKSEELHRRKDQHS